MKWRLPFLMLFIIIILTSCSEEEESIQKNTPEEMYNFSTTIPDAVIKTRAVTINRYVLEVYKTSDPTTVIKRVEQAGTNIVISLDANTHYTCLFWADGVIVNDNTNGTYNALDLKNVTLNAGKEMEEAFFARLDITDETTTFDVTLRRATAQVSMVETQLVTANTALTVTYNQYNSFNTFTSEVIGTAVATSKTFNSSSTIGILGTFQTFASVVGVLSNFTAVYNSVVANEMTNVPLKANYITNIRGSFATGVQDFAIVLVLDQVWESVIGGVDINVGTPANPKWIRVADRNTLKGGTHGATAGATATDYGSYYQWSNATNDPSNADKAYLACFDFAEGNGTWRLPTREESFMLTGHNGSGNNIEDNANRKLKHDATTSTWKIYSERVGQTADFVYLPLAGIFYSYPSGGASELNSRGYYWASTKDASGAWFFSLFNFGATNMGGDPGVDYQSVRCVRDVII